MLCSTKFGRPTKIETFDERKSVSACDAIRSNKKVFAFLYDKRSRREKTLLFVARANLWVKWGSAIEDIALPMAPPAQQTKRGSHMKLPDVSAVFTATTVLRCDGTCFIIGG